MPRRASVPLLVIALIVLLALSACALPTGRITEPLSPQEQQLLSTALKTSLHEKQAGIPEGASVALRASSLRIDASLKGFVSQNFVEEVLAGWLGKQGINIRDDAAQATHRVQAIIESFGYRQGIRFLGIPGGQNFFISWPELALWKKHTRQGYMRFYLDVYEQKTGRLLSSTEPFIGTVTTRWYTVFFFIRWQKTDLDPPLEQF